MDARNSAVIRVLVVDDHPMVREGLRSMLTGDAVEVVGDASTGAEAVGAAGRLAPDVVLLDVELPDVDGIAAIARIKAVAPRASVRNYALSSDEVFLQLLFKLGYERPGPF